MAEAVWRNPGDLRALDTAVHARFWHNRTDSGNIGEVEPGLGERDFGSSRRIPIAPANDCNVRIEAGFTIQLVRPDVYDVGISEFTVDCQLFEDGQLVALGTLSPDSVGRIPELLIPADLFNPRVFIGWLNLSDRSPLLDPCARTAFLQSGPSCCGECPPICLTRDRLGDDGDVVNHRKRDVEYVFTARTMEFNRETDGLFTDPTPAMVQFTVTVSDESRRDEQPIKVFSRE